MKNILHCTTDPQTIQEVLVDAVMERQKMEPIGDLYPGSISGLLIIAIFKV